mmetsp:Transcript_27249/g.77344  ORF Transcript_27249/g.77344 Transcript_27249/m.77344 type:complete len:541 (-) Transcript_27249:51-1673(-)
MPAAHAGCSHPGGRQQRLVRGLHQVVARKRHDVVRQVLRDHMLLRDAGDAGRAAEAHHHLQLVLQHVHHAHDALLAVGRQGVQHRPPDADAGGAQGHGLEDVRASPDAAVHEDGEVLALRAGLAQRLHDLGQDLDTRAASVQLPAAVVREHTARQAGLVGHDSVLSALHALQQDLHLRDALEPRHILPRQAGVDVAADGTGRALGAVDLALVLLVGLDVGALLRELVAHVLLPPSELRSVHGDEERLDARRLQLLHVFLRARTLRVHVELREELLPGRARGEHLLERVGAQRRQHVRHARLLRGPHDGHLPVIVCQLPQGGRCKVERQRRAGAQEGRPHVDLPHIHKNARPHRDALEGHVVVPQCDLVIASAGVVAPSLRLHGLPRHGLEVEGVQHRRQRRLHELRHLQLLGSGSARNLLRGRLLGCRSLRDVLLLDRRGVHDAHRQRRLQQLLHDVLWVDRVEERRGVLARIVEDQVRPARVHLPELRQVVGLAIQHHPTVLLRAVLRHLLHGQRPEPLRRRHGFKDARRWLAVRESWR